MAEDKKAILVYADWIDKFEELDDDEAGRLIKHFFRYVNDMNPEAPDKITKISFIDIENSLKRDLKKWEKTLEGRSKAGKASAAARANKKEQASTNPTSVKSVKQKSTNPTVSDNVNVTVNGNVSVKENVKVKDIIKVYSKEVNECFEKCVFFFPSHLHPKENTSWLDTIEKLNRIEKIPFDIIESIVKKTRNDDFWASNFLSLTKLRKKNKDGVMWAVVFNEKMKSNEKARGTNNGATASTVSQGYIDRLNDQLQS